MCVCVCVSRQPAEHVGGPWPWNSDVSKHETVCGKLHGALTAALAATALAAAACCTAASSRPLHASLALALLTAWRRPRWRAARCLQGQPPCPPAAPPAGRAAPASRQSWPQGLQAWKGERRERATKVSVRSEKQAASQWGSMPARQGAACFEPGGGRGGGSVWRTRGQLLAVAAVVLLPHRGQRLVGVVQPAQRDKRAAGLIGRG